MNKLGAFIAIIVVTACCIVGVMKIDFHIILKAVFMFFIIFLSFGSVINVIRYDETLIDKGDEDGK
jgi:type IV secretory pathway VirB2 component (pilin)